MSSDEKKAIPFVIFIPARCGSKRVRMKNIKPLAGKPLIYYTIHAAQQADVTSAIYVSTDCEDIAAVAEAFGAKVMMRPEKLARDDSSTESAMLHFLEQFEKGGDAPEWIMTLPPTSPLRTAETIRNACEKAGTLDGNIDALFSVHPTREDFWVGDFPECISRLYPNAPRRQQDRTPMWIENSCLYLTRVAALERTGFILGKTNTGFEIPTEESFDINSEMDFFIAEQVYKSRAKGLF